jgi:Polycystin cation channel
MTTFIRIITTILAFYRSCKYYTRKLPEFQVPKLAFYRSSKYLYQHFTGAASTYTSFVQELQVPILVFLQELREGLWISRATRLIVLDFTFYNANINAFTVTKLVMEFLPTGGFLLNPQTTTVQVTPPFIKSGSPIKEKGTLF